MTLEEGWSRFADGEARSEMSYDSALENLLNEIGKDAETCSYLHG